MDKQIDDYCEGKTMCLENSSVEFVKARRKWNDEIESIAEKSKHLLSTGTQAPHLLQSGVQNNLDH